MAEPTELTSTTPTTASNLEATNVAQLNQNLGVLLEQQGTQNTEVVAKIDEIAAAITADIIGGTTGTTINRVLVAKGTTGRALQATPVTINPSTGDTDFNGADIVDVDAFSANSGAFANTLTKGGVNVAVVNQTIGIWSGTWKSPENETVSIVLNFPFAVTITQTDTITEVGTATVQVRINGTPLGGTSNSASTSLNTQAHSSANVVSTTNSLTVVFTSTSSDCENLCLTIWGTRVLAAS